MSTPQVFEIAFRLGASVAPSMRAAFANANDNLGSMETRSSVLNRTMKGLAITGAAAGAAFVAVGVGIKGAVSAASEYDQAMRNLQVTTGSTAKQMAEIKDISKNLYNQNFGEDWNDLADAVSTTKSVTKLTGKELETATKNALIYRDTFDGEVAESIKVADTMMKNFGITNTQSFNLLAQGAQKGLDKSGELLDSANEYAPQFAALGFNAGQMFDTFSVGLENGAFNLDKVGDAVKEFNIRSKDGSKASAEAYQALGMNASKMTATFAAGGPAAKKAFDTVVNAISKVKDPAEKTAISVGLFGTQAEDLESTVIAAMGGARKQFDMTKQTMESIGDIKYESLSQFWQGMGRQIETGIVIPIGEKVLPVLNYLSKGVASHMPAITKTIETNISKVGSIFTAVPQLFKGTSDGMVKFQDILTKSFGQESGLKIITFFMKIKDGVDIAQKYLDKAKLLVGGVIAAFQGNSGKSSGLLSLLGLSPESIVQVQNIVSKVVDEVKFRIDVIKTVAQGIAGYFVAGFNIIAPLIRPALTTILSFVGETMSKIQQFWSTDGAAIIQAAQNVFGFLLKTVQFIMPAVLFIINMVWGNIKGVITGALNIIMGVVRIFTGLFTGDFAKMWQGVKQLFFGAIQFVWNLVQLVFYGKILGAIKSLASKGISSVANMWTGIKNFFTGGAANASAKLTEMGAKLRSTFGKIKDFALNMMRDMWIGIRGRFDEIVTGAATLPSKIGAGIRATASKALDGMKYVGNLMLSGIGNVVNGVAKGLNWAMKKLNIDFVINEWAVPQYARGTKSHPGGPAILGDGGGAELYRTPAGQLGLSPATDTLMNLPKGTQVIPARQTTMLLNQLGIPAYNTGTLGGTVKAGMNWLGDKYNAGKEYVGEKVGAVKDAALDVFGYLSNPTGLMTKLLEKFGVKAPDLSGVLGKIGAGGFNLVKEHGIAFLKSKLANVIPPSSGVSLTGGNGGGFGAPFRLSSRPGPRNTGILGASRMHKGWDWAAPVGTPIPSVSAGVVARNSWNAISGKFVEILSGNLIHRYQHNSRNAVNVGQQVSKGQTVGYVGSTGVSSGPHLHYEVKKAYAKGGTAFNTQYALVGEEGPEIAKFPGGTKITNNKKSNSLISRILSFGSKEAQPTVNKVESSTPVFSYSPTFNFNGGNVDRTMLEEAFAKEKEKLEAQFREFIRKMEDEKRRLQFG